MHNPNQANTQRSVTEHVAIGELPRLRRAVELLSHGSCAESKVILEQILLENAVSIEANYLLGLALIELHDYSEAVRTLQRSLALSPSDPAAMFALATAFYKLKDYRSAIDWYRSSLTLDPSNFEIANGLATALCSTGATQEALEIYDRLLKERPQDPITHINRGNTYQASKDHVLAIADYRTALATLPDDPQVRQYLANSLIEIGDRSGAISELTQASRLNPQDFDIRIRLAQVLIESEQYEAGDAAIQSVIDSRPTDIQTLASVGILYQKLERWNQALKAYDDALGIDPTYSVALLNRGTVNAALGRTLEALRDYDECIQRHPNSPDALFNRGNLFQKIRQVDSAEADFRNGLLIRPDHLGLNQNLAVLLFKQGRFSEAVVAFTRVADLVEDKYDALLNLAQAHLKTGNILASLKCNDAALSIRPEGEYLLGLVVHQKMMLCDWRGWSTSVETLANAIRDDKPVAMPFHLLAMTDDPELQLRCARNYTDRRFNTCGNVSTAPTLPARDLATNQSRQGKKPKIRLAYFSSDFYRHATTLLISEVIERHSRENFEVIAYHFASISDDVTQRIKSACDEFYDVSRHSSEEIIALARRNRLDIAIDLKGHTENSRPEIFAAKVAPIQINYLGFPGTMGASFIDYIVADAEVIPPGHERFYSERVIRLAPCYQPNETHRLTSSRIFSRQELCLPDDFFVYCCFNNSYKITPTIFDVWMRVLNEVPKSVLWLLSCNPIADENLRREATLRGVNPDRLVFAATLENSMHLSRLRHADLFLDTFPCSAHTTASDCLWSGVPLITLQGATFASRVASSLLRTIGLREMITHSMTEYETVASSLGRNRKAHTELRTRVCTPAARRLLFNASQYLHTWESKLQSIASHGNSY